MSNSSDCSTTCTFLTSFSFVLSVPLAAFKNGNDAQNIKDQKQLGLGSASPKDPQLWPKNDVEDMLDDLRAQEILGPKEDLLAAIERIPKPVTIEAAAQKECKAPGKTTVLEPSEGDPVKSAVQASSEAVAFGKAVSQIPNKASTPVRAAVLAPNMGVAPSPPLSESLFTVKAVLPTLSKNASSAVSTAPPSSEAAAEGKTATPSMSSITQMKSTATGKASVPAPSNTTTTAVAAPLASYKGMTSYRTIVPTQSEAAARGRVAAWAPSKDVFSSAAALPASSKVTFFDLPAPSVPTKGSVKTAVSATAEAAAKDRVTVAVPGKAATSIVAAPLAPSKVAFSGLASSWAQREGQVQARDGATAPSMLGFSDTAVLPVSDPASGRDPFLGVATVQPIKQAFSGLAAPPVPSKDPFTVKAAVPKLGIDAISAAVPATVSAKASSMDSDPGKAVTLATNEATAQGKVSVPEPSKFAFSYQTASRSAPSERSVSSPGRDPILGVTAAQATGMVAFSGLAVSLAPNEGPAVPNFGKDAVTALAPVLSMGSTVGKNAVSTTNEAEAQGRAAEATPARFSLSGQAASSIPSEGSVPVEGTKPEPRRTDAFFGAASVKTSGKDVSLGRATTLATSGTAAQDKASVPEPSKFATPPSVGKTLVKDSVPPPGRDGFLAMSAAKAPIRVAYPGIDSGATLSCGAVQGKAIVSPTSHSVSQGSDVIRKASRVAFLDLAGSPEPGDDSISVKGDIPRTIKDTLLGAAAPTAQSKGLVSAEGTIRASSYPAASSVAVPPVPSESQVLVKAASPMSNQGSFLVTATVQAQTEAAASSKVTVPAPSKVEALDVAVPSEPTRDLSPVKATQPTTCVDLSLLKIAEIATREAATLDKAAAPASVGIKGSLTHESESPVKPAVLASVKDAPPTLFESADLRNVAVPETNKGLATGKAAVPVPRASSTPVQETNKEPAVPSKDVVPASDEAAAEGEPFVQVPHICLGQVNYAEPAQNVASAPMKPLVQVESEVPTPSKASALCEIAVPIKSVVPAPIIPAILASDESASETSCETSAIVEAAAPEPSKDFATVKAVRPASSEVPPVSCEASATVKAAVPSASSDTVDEVEAAKPATSEVFAPEGGAFPRQSEATAPVKATPSPDTAPSDATIQRPTRKAL